MFIPKTFLPKFTCSGSQCQIYCLVWVRVKNGKTTDVEGARGRRAARVEFSPWPSEVGDSEFCSSSVTCRVTVWGGPFVSQKLPQLTHLGTGARVAMVPPAEGAPDLGGGGGCRGFQKTLADSLSLPLWPPRPPGPRSASLSRPSLRSARQCPWRCRRKITRLCSR